MKVNILPPAYPTPNANGSTCPRCNRYMPVGEPVEFVTMKGNHVPVHYDGCMTEYEWSVFSPEYCEQIDSARAGARRVA